MEKIEAVVFDMDGVLFDTERVYTEAWYEVGGNHNMKDLDEVVLHCVGLNHTDARNYFKEKYGQDFPVEQFTNETSKRFQELIEENGLPIKPGVLEMLKYLKDKGIKTAVASSSKRENIERHLSEAGFLKYFQYLIGGDMVEHGKPHPDIYSKACKGLGVLPGHAIAVEDSPNGIRSASGAGIKTIMIPDLIEPTSEIEALLYNKFDNMHQMHEFFKDNI